MLPKEDSKRKSIQLLAGFLDYFPDAAVAVAQVSKAGNDKHNPGEPMHWSRGKSYDHAESALRHLLDRGGLDEDGNSHLAHAAWRILAALQLECEAQGAPMARGATP